MKECQLIARPAHCPPHPGLFCHPGLYISHGKSGAGVFCSCFLQKGVLIEQCTFIPVEKEKIKDSPVMDIVFASGDPLKPNLITHGFGNIYNHGQPPNIAYRLHPRGYYEFFTLRDVEPHTELCSSYGRRWWAQRGRQPLP